MSNVRLNIFDSTAPLPICWYFFIVKLIALPTANKKDGKTRSVGVKPFQAAWFSGQKAPLLPGVLTMIMKQIVIPRKTSSDKNLGEASVVILGFLFSSPKCKYNFNFTSKC